MTVYKDGEEWVLGEELQPNDVVDVEDKPFVIKKFAEYTGPATEVTGSGRIATSLEGETTTVLDGQSFRKWKDDWN